MSTEKKIKPQVAQSEEEGFPKSVTQADFCALPREGFDFERYPVNNVFTSERKYEEKRCYSQKDGIYEKADEKIFNFSHWSTYHPGCSSTPKSVCQADYDRLPEGSYQFTRHYNMKDPSLLPHNVTFRGRE